MDNAYPYAVPHSTKNIPKFHFQRGFPFGKTDDEVG